MNKRIRELADEAGFMDSWFSESGDDCEQELKKFAELLIRECAEVGLDSVEDGDDGDAIMKRVHDNILKHFGVDL
jgi:hypothetical protein